MAKLKITENISIDNLKELIKQYYDEITAIYSYTNLYCKLNVCLSKKYKALQNKWYVWAMYSFSDSMLNGLFHLYNDQNNELSLYNLLAYLRENIQKYNLSNVIDKLSFDDKCLTLRKKLIKRRNAWQVHWSKAVLDKNLFDKLTHITIEDCYYLWESASKIILLLYKELFFEIPNQFSSKKCEEQIQIFIDGLNENGDL